MGLTDDSLTLKLVTARRVQFCPRMVGWRGRIFQRIFAIMCTGIIKIFAQ
jgi:hypothetical protein